VLPTTFVTVNLAPEAVPVSVLPILGKIPLILVNTTSTVAMGSMVTLTYFTLAGGFGG